MPRGPEPTYTREEDATSLERRHFQGFDVGQSPFLLHPGSLPEISVSLLLFGWMCHAIQPGALG